MNEEDLTATWTALEPAAYRRRRIDARGAIGFEQSSWTIEVAPCLPALAPPPEGVGIVPVCCAPVAPAVADPAPFAG